MTRLFPPWFSSKTKLFMCTGDMVGIFLFASNTSVSNIVAGAFSSPVSSCLCFSFFCIIRLCHSTSLVFSWFVAGFLEVQVKTQSTVCLMIFSWLSEGLSETGFLNV